MSEPTREERISLAKRAYQDYPGDGRTWAESSLDAWRAALDAAGVWALLSERDQLREAAQKLREAGGKLYPGSPPGHAASWKEYRAALAMLGLPEDGWSTWLDALDVYSKTCAVLEKSVRENPAAT